MHNKELKCTEILCAGPVVFIISFNVHLTSEGGVLIAGFLDKETEA